MKNRVGRRDIIFLLVAVILAVLCLAFTKGLTKEDGKYICITVDGDIYGEYSLNEDRNIDIEIDGKTTNTVCIENGLAYMTSADCPDKLCINQGKIKKDGEMIVCLPNKVVVEVEANDEDSLDSISK